MTSQGRWLILCLVAVTGCSHADKCKPCCDDEAAWTRSHLAARDALRIPLAAQAANGAILDATLFNAHFAPVFQESYEEDIGGGVKLFKTRRKGVPIRYTAELLPAGVAVVQRQIREMQGPTLHLYVQAAQDVPLDTKDADLLAKSNQKRATLNEDRASAVRALATTIRPDLDVRVTVIDIADRGMSGREAQYGLPKLYAAPEGKLSPEAVLGATIGSYSLFGGLSGGAVGGTNAPAAPPPAAEVPPPPPPAAGAADGGLNPGG